MVGFLAVALAGAAISLVLGSGVARAAHVPFDSPLVPVAGLGLALSLAATFSRLPAATVSVLVALGVAFAGALALTRGRVRVGLAAVVAAALTVATTAVPFVAAGRFGILGVAWDDDLREHLVWVDAVRSGIPYRQALVAPYNPMGAHALAASLAALLGTTTEAGLLGLTAAAMVVGTLSVVRAVEHLHALARVAIAVAPMGTYLAAAYYGWGSFKEVIVGALLVGCVVGTRAELWRGTPLTRAAVPLGLAITGALTVYGPAGLAWFLGVAAAWCALALAWRTVPARRLLRRGPAVAGVAGLTVLVASAPQLADYVRFGNPHQNGFLADTSLWTVVGVWPSPTVLIDPGHAAIVAAAGAIGFAVLIACVVWSLARRELAVSAGVLGCAVIYVVARSATNGYVTTKGLVIGAPLVALAVAEPVLTAFPGWVRAHGPSWRLLPAAAVATYAVVAVWSSADALRLAAVQPRDKDRELASIRPLLKDRPVLFLGDDLFVHWQLRGSLSSAPGLKSAIWTVAQGRSLAMGGGESLDFDSFAPDVLDRFAYALAPRTAYASAAPPNWHLVEQLPDYLLYERRGPTPARERLDTLNAPGATLDCSTPEGQRLERAAGEAAVRRPPVLLPLGRTMDADEALRTTIDLPAGRWEIALQYRSHTAVQVQVGDFRARLRPDLDSLGPFWRVGTLDAPGGPLPVAINGEPPRPFAGPRPTTLLAAAFTPLPVDVETVPLRRACGRYVDWYRVEDPR